MVKQRQPGRERLAFTLERLIRLGLYLILFTLLLMWSGFLYPHLTAKVLGFQVLVELVFAAFVIVILLRAPELGTMLRPLRAPLVLLPAAFLGYSLLTSICAVDPNLSLWGLISRQDGLVLQLHLLAWLVVTVCLYGRGSEDPSQPDAWHSRQGESFHFYLYCSFWVSVLAALTALSGLDVDFVGFVHSIRSILASPDRISGAFGNPIFLGSYLLLHFFFGLYFLQRLFRLGTHRSRREDSPCRHSLRNSAATYAQLFALVLGLAIVAGTLLAGQTRGVMLALILSLLAVCSLLVLGRSTKRVIRIAGFVAVTCIILGAAVTWRHRDSPIFKQIRILQRPTHIFDASDPSTAYRLLSWGSGLRSSLEHPLLGWGYNNAYYALNKHYDPRQFKYEPVVDPANIRWSDKSHNFFIDLLIERGIMGVLLYFLLLGVTAKSLLRLADRHLAVCMAGALLSYLISNAFAFDSFGSLFGFFLAMGCIAAAADPSSMWWPRRRVDHPRDVSQSARKRIPRASRSSTVGISAVIILLAAGIYLQADIAIANHEYLAARAAFAQDPSLGASKYAEAFGRLSPYAGKEKLTCLSLLVKSVLTNQPSSRAFVDGSLLLQLSNEVIAAHTQDGASYLVLNDMYNNLAAYLNREFSVQAEVFGTKALELLPNHQPAMYHLARTYVIRNEPARAVELNRRMLRDADWSDGHLYLGLSLLSINNQDEARKEIRKAIEMGSHLSGKQLAFLKGRLTDKEIADLTAGK